MNAVCNDVGVKELYRNYIGAVKNFLRSNAVTSFRVIHRTHLQPFPLSREWLKGEEVTLGCPSESSLQKHPSVSSLLGI